MGQLYAGTSGWAYPTWKPGFYPANVPARKFLSHYASRLSTVEVNYTFRSTCTDKQLAGWLADTPPDFRFSFKAPQSVTHIRRLRECSGAWQRFVESLAPASSAERVAALLLQFPPNFRSQSAGKDKKKNFDALGDFLSAECTNSRMRLAIEFRDASWFTPETFALLREHNVALCWAESDELETPREQTADFCYLRLRCSAYDSTRIQNLRRNLLATAESGDVFAYFKHEEPPDGPLRAEQLLRG